MPTVLLIEDDRLIVEPVVRALKGLNYTVLTAYDGAAGLDMALNRQPDLIILDIMLPEMDGWEVCKAVRRKSVVPILMLTAKGEDYDQVEGLESGADDYIIKPFTPMVLAARIQALLRRSGQSGGGGRFGNLEIDPDAREVRAGGETVPLSRKEYELLAYLAENNNISLSRDQILESVWGYDYLGSSNTVDTHINRLRTKLGACGSYSGTLRGYGYRFEVHA
jgi:DNA-binding response OmpR family regulator